MTKKYRETNEAMRVGSFVHNVLARYTEACIEQKTDSDVGLIQEAFDHYWETSGVPEERFIEIKNALWQFAERALDQDKILKIEHTIKVPIPGTHYEFWARIDRANSYRRPDGKSVLEIVDYKNSARIMPVAEVQDDLQCRCYRWAALTSVWQGYDFFRHGIHHTRYNRMVWSGEPKQTWEFEQDNDDVATMLAREAVRILETPDEQCKATPGSHCWEYTGCPILLAGDCPRFSEEARAKALAGNDIPERVRTIRAMRAELDNEAKKLKAMFENRSPLDVDGKKVGFAYKATQQFPLVPFNQLAIDRGLSLDHITVSKTDATKACGGKRKLNKDPDLSAALSAIATEAGGTRFSY